VPSTHSPAPKKRKKDAHLYTNYNHRWLKSKQFLSWSSETKLEGTKLERSKLERTRLEDEYSHLDNHEIPPAGRKDQTGGKKIANPRAQCPASGHQIVARFIALWTDGLS
jgi:hypothetical protein